MNVFFVHSGCDKTKVDELIQKLQKINSSSVPLKLGNGGRFWKIDARRKIKNAQLVVVVLGEHSHESDNIGWEIRTAQRFSKYVVYYCLHNNVQIHKNLTQRDQFSNKTFITAKKVSSVEEISDMINKYDACDYDIFNQSIETISIPQLMEQYKFFVQTSETLVQRRQNVNSFYITLNTAVIALASSVTALTDEIYVKAGILAAFACIGIILDVAWHNLLESYGRLNSSKMKVISMIEKKLPLSLFDTEWSVMSDKLNNKRYVSFTESEKKIPIIFCLIYVLMIFISVAVVFMK